MLDMVRGSRSSQRNSKNKRLLTEEALTINTPHGVKQNDEDDMSPSVELSYSEVTAVK